MKNASKMLIAVFMLVLAVLVVLIIFRGGLGGSAPDASPPPTDVSEPTDSPAPTPETVESRAAEILAGMSDREKICQLFVVRPQSIGSVTGAEDGLRTALEEYPVGGFVFFSDNLESGGEEVKATISKMQEWSRLGLIICADEEGGRVNRLMSTLGTTWLDSMFSYRDQGIDKAYSNAATIARDMKSFGFNTDLAPVADVFSNPENTVIGDRAYSDDFVQASQLVSAAVSGFKDSGFACAVKHFPGHGDTSEDTHVSSALITKSVEELFEQELLPFIAGIDAGADMVMIGHLTIKDLDDEPATVSYSVVTGLLRERMGYSGVVITDSLEMGAITGYAPGQLAVRVLNAGIDILLDPSDFAASVEGIELALEVGELTMERIDESVLRILIMKLENGIIS